MLIIRPTSRFKKDVKHAIKQGRELERLKLALETLAAPEPLPSDFRDHKLKGKWRDFRECHIESDLLLIVQNLIIPNARPSFPGRNCLKKICFP